MRFTKYFGVRRQRVSEMHHWPRTCVAALLLLVNSVSVLAANNKTEGCSQVFSAERPVLISSRRNDSSAPVHCSYLVHAPPDTFPGRVFQVTFEHFNVGHRTVSGGACQHGWVKIENSLFCGTGISPNTFLLAPTTEHYAKIHLVVHPGEKTHDFQARIELLSELTLQEKHHEMILVTPGKKVPFTECDRIYNCLEYPGYCQVNSPSYPGVYIRPMNCSFFLKSPEPGVIVGGRYELFEVGGGLRLFAGAACDLDDHLEIYDGGELVAKFCGRTKKFPRIVTKTRDVMIRFVSTHAGPPSKGFALSVERSPPHLADNQIRCSQTFKVGSSVESLKSPHHWLAPKSHCSYHLVTKPGKQIWLAFKSLRTRSSCSEFDDHVQVWDGLEMILSVCRNSSLTYPVVSKSNQLKIVYVSPTGTFDASSRLFFQVKFTAVNSIETGQHVNGTWCDMEFRPHRLGGPFSLLNPKEILLAPPKMPKVLLCRYRFIAPEGHTVRLHLNHAVFEPLFKCNNAICDPNVRLNTSYDRLIVTEKIESIHLGCECGGRVSEKHQHPLIYHSRGSEMVLQLKLRLNPDLLDSSTKNSPELYQFQGRYQFMPPDPEHLHCGHGKIMVENATNSASFFHFPTVDKYVSSPILCQWNIQANISKIRIEKLNLAKDCRTNFLQVKVSDQIHKLCHDSKSWNVTLEEPVDTFKFTLMASKGAPHVLIDWSSDERESELEECYDMLTLALLTICAAIVTMCLVLMAVMLVWRVRGKVWTIWRRKSEQRYNTVTVRHSTFW
ncbi:uncharacterized protein LOC135938749 [Cloeon dipterum]|uniref:uncharacterized protein LOC135938749 n=1 Tax=Cloeon dipterum TaxID=197152 RepID=UPI00321FC04C